MGNYNYTYDDNGFWQAAPKEKDPNGCWWKSFLIPLGFIIAMLVLMSLSGCRSVEYVPVIEHRTDTVRITKHERDSIHEHDSIHVKEKQQGDTVWLEVEKWHTRTVERLVHDTTYIATHDTVPEPYPVEVEVEKELSWWQQLRLWLGTAALIIILAAAGYGIVRIWLRR